jgi:hypothetical protein
MSMEYRPVSAIQFSSLDNRLEKYGIKVEVSGHTIAMRGRNGVLFAKPEGESIHCERKLGVDTEDVLEAIRTEFGVEIVDENDHRFWGFSSKEAMLDSFGFLTEASNSAADQCVVIEGPPSHDVDFAIMWLKAARKADLRWDRLTWNNPEADELWEKLCSYSPMYETLHHRPDLDFGTAALSFVGEWLTNASFVLNVSSSRRSEHFSLMLFAGLFVQRGGRYQMAIPDEIDIRKVCDRLADWLKRMDQEKLSPNGLFVTLSERDAKS